MAEKQALKASEARILVYLAVVNPSKSYPKAISAKLDIDYAYLLNILGRMAYKHWIKQEAGALRTYYKVNPSAPLEKAKELLAGGKHDILRHTIVCGFQR